ncbi:hypothetical protein [Nocardia terpenica]|uniref:Uncharacterized protein n=1 Tax=Nocardia terpenica TaxID=455432 RepID=A0A6G9ZDG1_9NOCA|nr:hypothetical protein [Nocardia terpenica]QIS23655.1 hypothetical protein F6W96_40685 [Nocardia terpenica]
MPHPETTPAHNLEIPRRFVLIRDQDVTGFSGTGVVAVGVAWSDGPAVMRWCVNDLPRTIVVADRLTDIETIHGHDGMGHIRYLDNTERRQP